MKSLSNITVRKLLTLIKNKLDTKQNKVHDNACKIIWSTTYANAFKTGTSPTIPDLSKYQIVLCGVAGSTVSYCIGSVSNNTLTVTGSIITYTGDTLPFAAFYSINNNKLTYKNGTNVEDYGIILIIGLF